MITALRALLRRTAPVRLTGAGKFKGFRLLRNGKLTKKSLRGLTKRLHSNVYSKGALPAEARKGEARGKLWKGVQGGRKRGAAIDRQVSSVVNKRAPKRLHKLSKIVINAISGLNLTPIIAQRGVAHAPSNVASAADVLAYDATTKTLVVVELKTGHAHGKLLAAKHNGVEQTMCGDMRKASDCVAHRHLAQLSATRQMLVNEHELMRKLAQLGVKNIGGMLLYATDTRVETVTLVPWWSDRGNVLLKACS